MSFAAADCSGGSNPLLQFNKHTQQDRSLQRQAIPGAVQQSGQFRKMKI